MELLGLPRGRLPSRKRSHSPCWCGFSPYRRSTVRRSARLLTASHRCCGFPGFQCQFPAGFRGQNAIYGRNSSRIDRVVSGETTTATSCQFFAAARIIVGPPMSMFSINSSSGASFRAATFSNSYRLTRQPCRCNQCHAFQRLHVFRIRPNGENSAGDHGWMVLTRPSSISGKPVTSETSRTGMASFREKSRSSACRDQFDAQRLDNPRANAATPVLSVTLRRARRDSGHGKALFLHVLETHIDVRRYTSMEDFAVSRLSVSHDPIPEFLYSIRGFALSVHGSVAQVVGQTAPAGKST